MFISFFLASSLFRRREVVKRLLIALARKRFETCHRDEKIPGSAGERAAVLEKSCSADPDLRREVESLLEAREDAVHFLSRADLTPHLATLGNSKTAPVPGSLIGPYRILSLLGAGGMGEVYRARDTRLERDVALKLLPAHFTDDPGRVARFRQEAKAASALNHPNIVTIYDIGQAGETWFIAAELVAGVTQEQTQEFEKASTEGRTRSS